MRTKIASLHFKASDTLKEFAESEVQRLVKLSDDILSCEVEFSYAKNTKQAHVHISVNGSILNASETTDDFQKSLSLAVDKLEIQLKKLKGKKIAKRTATEE
ncbi:ribosome-associated translation inhibitor RaiA [candidate division KSB1 bacterium]|nr:MAG: ribosome-associated translation inhibitor RaiA [candidate division KSB1 bacterium]